MFKVYFYYVPFYPVEFVYRTGILNTFTMIRFCQCPISKPLAYLFFLRRMNKVTTPDIHRRYHSRVRDHLHQLLLHLTKISSRRAICISISMRSYFHIIERKSLQTPTLAIVIYHNRKHSRILFYIMSVTFSLIPNHSFNHKVSQGSHLRIK